MDQTASSPVHRSGSRATLPVVLGVLAIATFIPAWVTPILAKPIDDMTQTTLGVLGSKDVTADSIAGLRVVSWDEVLSAARIFEVKRDGDRWIIPSNYNYPADGNTRLSRTSAGILGVEKGRLVTDKVSEHESLGVIDPLEPPAGATSGFGKRVTLTDNTGNDVLDVIVGTRAAGSDGLYNVREAGHSEVFTARVVSDLSTKFTDYVEVDPFKIKREDVRGVAVVDYAVDPDKGTITPGPLTKVARSGSNGTWESAQIPTGKRIATAKVDDVLSELSNLRLQGVRPFQLRWLQTHGFYAGDQPQLFQLPNALTVTLEDKPYALFGTSGRLDVTTGDGLRYSFMFGKIALGDDVDSDEEKSDPDTDGEKKDAGGSNRYLAVFVTYDASLDEVAKAEAAKSDEERKTSPPSKTLSGRARAAKAQERFQRFFYVISDSSFKKLDPDVTTWWEDKPAEPMAGTTGKTNSQWLEDNAKLPGITTTASGLQYQVLESGPDGGAKPTTSDTVRVAYKGTLLNGEQFDANDDMQFDVTGVIKGWTEALQLMKPGDKLKIFVPPGLGYGETGSPPKIGPNQILIFEVTLKEVVGKPGAAQPEAEAKPAVEEVATPPPAETPPATP